MMHNVGNTDRILRVVLGLVLISLFFLGPTTLLGWLGVIVLATALLRFCPAYAIFGINTGRTAERRS